MKCHQNAGTYAPIGSVMTGKTMSARQESPSFEVAGQLAEWTNRPRDSKIAREAHYLGDPFESTDWRT